MKLQAAYVLLGVVAGAALMSAFGRAPPAPGPRPDGTSELIRAIRELHDDLLRETSAIRQSSADLPGGVKSGRAVRGSGQVRFTDSAGGGPLPATRHDALARLDDWEESPETRRSWLFASEARVLREFGVPTRVTAQAGWEAWTYEDRRDGEVVTRYLLTMSRGRLIRVE